MFEQIPNLSAFLNSSFVAEFAASFLLVLFGCGVCANAALPKTKGNSGGYFMVVTGWAMGVALIVFLFSRASGAHANPAITLSLALAGEFPWNYVIPYTIAQFLGTFAGAVTVYFVYFAHFREPGDSDAKLTIFCTAPGERSYLWSFVAEMIATAVLLFIITGLGYAARDGEKVLFDPGFSALAVGLVILTIGLGMGGPTGFALNPARDLSPRIVHALLPIRDKRDSDWRYSWVPVIASLVGGPIGVFAWRLLFGAMTLPELLLP